MKQLSTRMIQELGEALRMFGTYSFDDKGSNEVMNTNKLVAELKKLSAAEAAEVLFEVAASKKHKGRGLKLACDLVVDLQDWDELFENTGVCDLLNGDPPGKPRNVTPVAIKAMSGADVMEQFLKNLGNS